jgi:hypothetical protein
VEVESKSPLTFKSGRLTDDRGRTLAMFSSNWKWEHNRAQAKFDAKGSATLAIATKPLAADQKDPGHAPSESTGWFDYDQQRKRCIETWRTILASGMNIETPEPVVDMAHKLSSRRIDLVADFSRFSFRHYVMDC